MQGYDTVPSLNRCVRDCRVEYVSNADLGGRPATTLSTQGLQSPQHGTRLQVPLQPNAPAGPHPAPATDVPSPQPQVNELSATALRMPSVPAENRPTPGGSALNGTPIGARNLSGAGHATGLEGSRPSRLRAAHGSARGE